MALQQSFGVMCRTTHYDHMASERHIYWSGWDGSGEEVSFTRYAQVVLEPFNVPLLDRDFLEDVGLPAWAAPHMHFTAPRGTVLPFPEDPFGDPFPGTVPPFGMIGSASDWPL